MSDEEIIELALKGARDPVRIMAEKEEGLKSNVSMEIRGNLPGICTLSKSFFQYLAKEIYKKDKDMFRIWAGMISKVLIDSLEGYEKEDGDED